MVAALNSRHRIAERSRKEPAARWRRCFIGHLHEVGGGHAVPWPRVPSGHVVVSEHLAWAIDGGSY
jgi:hypothetical protein